jgi:dTDP-4-dehydrorhamnose 3,5-epimerase-like enzyme
METCLIRFEEIKSNLGSLVAIQDPDEIPFAIQRVYYIYGVKSAEYRRGFHAHKDLEQVLICISGSVKILVKTPDEEKTFHLDDPSIGLFIGKMLWREMFEFSSDAVLLVLASRKYDEKDYYRDYQVFEKAYSAQRRNK